MTTKRLRADRDEEVREAARLLRAGELVAFPTETVYGLGANALDEAAVTQIFRAKERPSWDPLIVHVAAATEAGRVAEVGPVRKRAERLMEAFWPGPLTLLLPRVAGVPDAVTAGRERVGVRVPGHAVARRLLEEAGVPVAAPSANRFGHTSPTTAAHVLEDLDGRIAAVLDGGPTEVGVESTVVDVCEMPVRVYRPGAVTVAMLEAVLGEEVSAFRASELRGKTSREGLPSPGVGLRHYAPRARLILVGTERGMQWALQTAAGRVGVMLPWGWAAPGTTLVYDWGPWEDIATLARRVFAGLRELDRLGAEVILCPVPRGEGLAAALRDRLEKAAIKV